MTEHFQDHEVADKQFPVTYGVGLQFKDDEHYTLESVCRLPRVVHLRVSTWQGTSPGAMHYYANLEWFSLNFKVVKIPEGNPQSWKLEGEYNVGGYYDRHKPKEMGHGNVEITRPITKRDKRIDDGERFASYELGERTRCLDSLEEATLKARKEFERIFGAGWKLDESDLEGMH